MRAVGGGCRLYREEAGASRKQLVAAARRRQHEQPHDEPGAEENGAEGRGADGNGGGSADSETAGAGGSAGDSQSTTPRDGKGRGGGKGKGKTTGGQLANARFERWGSLLLAGVEPEEDAASTEAGVQVAKELRTVRVQAHHFQNLFLFATRMGRRGAACE